MIKVRLGGQKMGLRDTSIWVCGSEPHVKL